MRGCGNGVRAIQRDGEVCSNFEATEGVWLICSFARRLERRRW